LLIVTVAHVSSYINVKKGDFSVKRYLIVQCVWVRLYIFF